MIFDRINPHIFTDMEMITSYNQTNRIILYDYVFKFPQQITAEPILGSAVNLSASIKNQIVRNIKRTRSEFDTNIYSINLPPIQVYNFVNFNLHCKKYKIKPDGLIPSGVFFS